MNGDEARRLALQDGPLDYAAIGFRCGLEIHQQLATRKLFSPCPSGVVDPDEVAARTTGSYDRRLRATQSELGESDPAALAEAKKRRAFRYLAIDGLTSLVELDEEPPHPMAGDALDVALQFAGLLGARPADEVHVMRKTVIDGSNTSGFQRTALVATGGSVHAESDVGIWTIAVEEDSARKLDEQDGRTRFTLDRLGVPLIEVATAPDITSPQHAQAVAARLGSLLRATKRVRRGLGSIRQDLNVSVGVGDRVEIKGCQDLRAVPRVIEGEARRQLWLHHIAQTLRERGFDGSGLEQADVSKAFAKTDAKLVASATKRGDVVQALALPHWAGLIAGASKDGPRYGREFADHAKVAAGVKGIFHSDELPAYGITDAEVAAVRTTLGLGELDAFALCVAPAETAARALDAVADCARDALAGAGRAVRAAQPDDSTRYMRPLPGAARMYPETDVPPIPIPAARWKATLANLPMLPEARVAALAKKHAISKDIADQLVRDDLDDSFADVVAHGLDGAQAARILLQILPGLNNGQAVLARLPELADALAAGQFAKEAVPEVLAALDASPEKPWQDVLAAAGAEAADEGVVESVIAAVIEARIDFVRERGMAAMGPLMGPVMAELRGKADGALINTKLKAALEAALQ